MQKPARKQGGILAVWMLRKMRHIVADACKKAPAD
jgi:hypothetical protein